ncbi:GatB/YqeY domain-containing protein [Bacillus licheniformis]|uniref:GatB/YqeY domain-containing protein n=1 Tax=Bacillus licheniformis TaxID=1402 RepID=UPI001B282781|nr:GatB/YqeY domain-containing protein [Bacillus licheniformis]GIN25615.1 aspartyl-tRNA amidotransferase subunit B [Bacillus licheniformis]GIN29646.1 aspartyl-tRNA amidotransferase subunit B [Bacillus licheniformis]
MTELVQQIKEDVKNALKSKDKNKLSTLRLLVSKLEKEKITLKLSDIIQLNDDQVQTVIRRNIKELDKEIEAYKAVDRDASKQETEKQLLMSYLPKQLTENEVENVVSSIVEYVKVSGGNMGMAMKLASQELKGRADMKLVNQIVKQSLNKQ